MCAKFRVHVLQPVVKETIYHIEQVLDFSFVHYEPCLYSHAIIGVIAHYPLACKEEEGWCGYCLSGSIS